MRNRSHSNKKKLYDSSEVGNFSQRDEFAEHPKSEITNQKSFVNESMMQDNFSAMKHTPPL